MQMHDGPAHEVERPTGVLWALVVGAVLALAGVGFELMRVGDRELLRTVALADATTAELAQILAHQRAAEERQFGTEIARLEAAAARLTGAGSESSGNPVRTSQNTLAAARSTHLSRPERALRRY
jgi:hypothetical protein